MNVEQLKRWLIENRDPDSIKVEDLNTFNEKGEREVQVIEKLARCVECTREFPDWWKWTCKGNCKGPICRYCYKKGLLETCYICQDDELNNFLNGFDQKKESRF
jgi:hypothetical protein